MGERMGSIGWRRGALCMLMQVLVMWSGAAQAKEAAPESTDPVLETHVMRIAQDLRCLVCQNETLAASHADLAVDLRQEIREKLRQGQTDQQIRDFMVARYGDFVLFKPPVKPTTWLLWGGPFLLLCLAAWSLSRYLKQRALLAPAAGLSEADHARARQLLGRDLGHEPGSQPGHAEPPAALPLPLAEGSRAATK
jgi:cytochrome c-type biogenesis protein CcmH